MSSLDESTLEKILAFQKNEITEHQIYSRLAESVGNPENSKILKHISNDELRHYEFWKKHTGRDVEPDKWKAWKYYFISRILGITFGLKLMERGEELAQAAYGEIADKVPGADAIIKDEDSHEAELLNLLNEERLNYVGSMVLGINDALVELTGALAGFTLALQNTRLIAMIGLITGIAASMSMAASEYLSTKSEESHDRDPLKASIYTGIAYVFTVFLLIFPYLIFTNYYFCLGFAIFNAIIVIFVFTYYVSVAKDIPFRSRFLEMALISLSIAAISFGIGFVMRKFLNIDI